MSRWFRGSYSIRRWAVALNEGEGPVNFYLSLDQYPDRTLFCYVYAFGFRITFRIGYVV